MGKRGKALKRKRAGLVAGGGQASHEAAAEDSEPEAEGSDDEAGRADEADPLGGLTEADVAAAIRVAQHLSGRLELFRSRPFKPLRVALHPLVAEQVRHQAKARESAFALA